MVKIRYFSIIIQNRKVSKYNSNEFLSDSYEAAAEEKWSNLQPR